MKTSGEKFIHNYCRRMTEVTVSFGNKSDAEPAVDGRAWW
jgi:hypothetical protein